MAKFCGKCGSKLDEFSGSCPNCDNKNIVEIKAKSNHKKPLVLKILLPIIIFVIVASGFLALDYFDIIGTGISKNLGFKSSGVFELYSTSKYLFVSEDEQLLTFYCSPPKGYTPTLKGDYSAELIDDGQLENSGDLKDIDGIYSANIMVSESNPKTICIYAVAKDGLRFYESNVIEIEIKDKWSNEEIETIEEVDSTIQELICNDDFKKNTYEEKKEKVEQLFENISSNDRELIDQDSIYFDEEIGLYTFSYNNGDLGCVKIEQNPTEDGFVYGDSSSENGESDTQNDSKPAQNSNALIMYDWYTDNDEVFEFYQDYQKEWNEKGFSTTLTKNPTVEQYSKQLANNELILLASHGSRFPLKKRWFDSPVTYSVICTHEACTKDLSNQYKNDISQKNIIKANTEDGQFYWILPSFFNVHYGNGELNNTILLMDNCSGMGADGDIDYDLASAMTGTNSAAVGFHNSVCIYKYVERANDTYYALGYGTNFMKSMADYLMSGLTFAEAEQKTEKLYGSNQKQYMDDYWGSSDEEDESVFPMISGNGDIRLSISSNKNADDFIVSNKLVKVGSKYLVSDTKAIYLKNSIIEPGKRIVSMENTGHMMSDGEVVYFSVKADFQQSNDVYYDPYEIYSVNIDGSDLKLIYNCDHRIDFVTCYNNYLYFIDQKFESASFNKINLADNSNTVLISGSNPYCDHGKVFGNKVYFSGHLMDVAQITGNKVYSFDLTTEAMETVASGAVLPNDFYNITDRVYMTSFKYSFSGSTSHFYDSYIYYIDDEGNLKTSKKLPDDCSVSYLYHDASYAILYKFEKNNTSKVWYKFELSTGKCEVIKDLNNLICFEKPDFKNYEDIYFIQYPNNFAGNTVVARVSKLESNRLVSKKVGGDSYYNVNSEYWIVDGFFVNDRFQCFELS